MSKTAAGIQAEITRALEPLAGETERIRALQRASISIGGMDSLMEALPDEALTISHDPDSEWRVCTIVINWRLVPDELLGLPPRRGLRLVRERGDDG